VQIECPHCKRRLEIGDEQAGQVVNCGNCGGQMQVPAQEGPPSAPPEEPSSPSRPPAAEGSAPSAARGASVRPQSPSQVSGAGRPEKACRYCGERILAVAQKCKHCGSFLSGTRVRGPGGRGAGGDAEGTTALVCGIIGLVLVCFPLAPVILGGVAISSGMKARRKNPASGTGIAGLVMGTIDLVLGLIGLLYWLAMIVAGAAGA